MILIPLEEDKKTISQRFRKADYFLFVDENEKHIEKNNHKTSKSNEFFEYFKTLAVKKLYLTALGYKTFLKLEALGMEVFFLQEHQTTDEIEAEYLLKIDSNNAKELCTLGHK
jgi:predicted Fe-Mo cluster-binding NifX family protein